MPKRSSKKDFNELAFSIVQRATGEKPEAEAKAELASALNNAEIRKEIMREMGSRGCCSMVEEQCPFATGKLELSPMAD